jgi:demethylmenaquinone methyltransferase/2-methoxy-6-polyprenyl-1,4-benzoquinol methylase
MKLFEISSKGAAGSRPKGARDERDSARRIRDMFSDIAPRYDLLNHLLSFSMDNRWRRLTAEKFRRVLRRTDARVLDLCCGTGDLAFAFEVERVDVIRDPTAHREPIVGCDFAYPMVERARKKARTDSHTAEFINGDALSMPFPDGSFDLVATAFGFRNLANYERGLREIARVLKPGGRVAILEFSEPTNSVMAGMYRFYFRRILPLIGGMISGNRTAYSYLPTSVSTFPPPPELAKLLGSAGFLGIRYEAWNFGSVVLHTGHLPDPGKTVKEPEDQTGVMIERRKRPRGDPAKKAN